MKSKYNGKRITFRVNEKTRKLGEKAAKRKDTSLSEIARIGFEKEIQYLLRALFKRSK
jgi:hypothetical protein